MADPAKIPELVAKLAEPHDIVIVLGAGNVNRTIPVIIEKLEAGK